MTIKLLQSGHATTPTNLGGVIGPEATISSMTSLDAEHNKDGITDYAVFYARNTGTTARTDALLRFRYPNDTQSILLHPKKNELSYVFADKETLPDLYFNGLFYENTDETIKFSAQGNSNDTDALAVSSHGIFHRRNWYYPNGTLRASLKPELNDASGFFVDGDTLYALVGRRVYTMALVNNPDRNVTILIDDLPDSTIILLGGHSNAGIAVYNNLIYIADGVGSGSNGACYIINKDGTRNSDLGFTIPFGSNGLTLDEYRFYFASSDRTIYPYTFSGTAKPNEVFTPYDGNSISYYNGFLYESHLLPEENPPGGTRIIPHGLKKYRRRLNLGTTDTESIGSTVKPFTPDEFTTPYTETDALDLGNMAVNDYRAVYVKRELIGDGRRGPFVNDFTLEIADNPPDPIPPFLRSQTFPTIDRGVTVRRLLTYTDSDSSASDITMSKLSGDGRIYSPPDSNEWFWEIGTESGGDDGIDEETKQVRVRIRDEIDFGNAVDFEQVINEYVPLVRPVWNITNNINMDRDDSRTIELLVTDSDSTYSQLTVEKVSGPNWGTLSARDPDTDRFSFTIDPPFTAGTTYTALTGEFVLRVTDQDGQTADVTITANVNAYNPPVVPVWNIDETISVDRQGSQTIDLLVTDTDSTYAQLTVTKVSGPDWGELSDRDATTNRFSFTIDPPFVSGTQYDAETARFVLRVTDQDSQTSDVTITANVNAYHPPFISTVGNQSVPRGGTLTRTISTSDQDTDFADLELTTNVGTIDKDTANEVFIFRYTAPVAGSTDRPSSTVDVTLTLSDGHSQSVDNFTITIQEHTVIPSLTGNTSISTTYGQSITIPLTHTPSFTNLLLTEVRSSTPAGQSSVGFNPVTRITTGNNQGFSITFNPGAAPSTDTVAQTRQVTLTIRRKRTSSSPWVTGAPITITATISEHTIKPSLNTVSPLATRYGDAATTISLVHSPANTNLALTDVVQETPSGQSSVGFSTVTKTTTGNNQGFSLTFTPGAAPANPPDTVTRQTRLTIRRRRTSSSPWVNGDPIIITATITPQNTRTAPTIDIKYTRNFLDHRVTTPTTLHGANFTYRIFNRSGRLHLTLDLILHITMTDGGGNNIPLRAELREGNDGTGRITQVGNLTGSTTNPVRTLLENGQTTQGGASQAGDRSKYYYNIISGQSPVLITAPLWSNNRGLWTTSEYDNTKPTVITLTVTAVDPTDSSLSTTETVTFNARYVAA